MARVLYARHGQTESNIQGVFSGGGSDTPLTNTGLQQAEELGQDLKDADVSIDHIICSPKARAYDTAVIIAKKIGFDPQNIQKDVRLTERNSGVLVGTPIEDATTEMVINAEGSEKPQQVASRLREALKEISTYDGTTLIISHGGIAKMIDILQTNGDPDNFFDVPKRPNSKVFELDLSWIK